MYTCAPKVRFLSQMINSNEIANLFQLLLIIQCEQGEQSPQRLHKNKHENRVTN